MAEVQALLHDHAECGKHSAADVVAKAQAVLTEPEAAAGDVRRRLLSAEHAAGDVNAAADRGTSPSCRS